MSRLGALDCWRSMTGPGPEERVSSQNGLSGPCPSLCNIAILSKLSSASRQTLFSCIDLQHALLRGAVVFIKCRVGEVHSRKRIMQRVQSAGMLASITQYGEDQTCLYRSCCYCWKSCTQTTVVKDTWTHQPLSKYCTDYGTGQQSFAIK